MAAVARRPPPLPKAPPVFAKGLAALELACLLIVCGADGWRCSALSLLPPCLDARRPLTVFPKNAISASVVVWHALASSPRLLDARLVRLLCFFGLLEMSLVTKNNWEN